MCVCIYIYIYIYRRITELDIRTETSLAVAPLLRYEIAPLMCMYGWICVCCDCLLQRIPFAVKEMLKCTHSYTHAHKWQVFKGEWKIYVAVKKILRRFRNIHTHTHTHRHSCIHINCRCSRASGRPLPLSRRCMNTHTHTHTHTYMAGVQGRVEDPCLCQEGA